MVKKYGQVVLVTQDLGLERYIDTVLTQVKGMGFLFTPRNEADKLAHRMVGEWDDHAAGHRRCRKGEQDHSRTMGI